MSALADEIAFPSTMPGYRELADLVRAHAGKQARAEPGPREATSSFVEYETQSRTLFRVLGGGLVAAGVGLAIWVQVTGHRRLYRYALITRSGVWVEGRITGLEAKSGRAGSWGVVEYRFSIGGRSGHDSDTVSWNTLVALRKGQPVRVIALPARPDLCRSSLCPGRSSIVDRIITGYVAGISLGGFGALVAALPGLVKNKRRGTIS